LSCSASRFSASFLLAASARVHIPYCLRSRAMLINAHRSHSVSIIPVKDGGQGPRKVFNEEKNIGLEAEIPGVMIYSGGRPSYECGKGSMGVHVNFHIGGRPAPTQASTASGGLSAQVLPVWRGRCGRGLPRRPQISRGWKSFEIILHAWEQDRKSTGRLSSQPVAGAKTLRGFQGTWKETSCHSQRTSHWMNAAN